jgi:hypothetical protein
MPSWHEQGQPNPLPFFKSNTFVVYFFLAQFVALPYPVGFLSILLHFQFTLQNDL